MKNVEELIVCEDCKETFIKIMTYYFGNVDEKRVSIYDCPYCGKRYSVHLRGNEDVSSRKRD